MNRLVVGTGRSGTGYCQQVLRAAGVGAGHEQVFGPERVMAPEKGPTDWADVQVECSWLAVPYLPLPNVPTALVVRHPLLVVESMAHLRFGHTGGVFQLHARAYGGMTPDPDGWLRFWTNWNYMALDHAEKTFMLTDLVTDPTPLLQWADAPGDPAWVGVINPKDDIKEGPRPVFGWDDFDRLTAKRARDLWEWLLCG